MPRRLRARPIAQAPPTVPHRASCVASPAKKRRSQSGGDYGGDRLAGAFGARFPGRVVRKKLELTLQSENGPGWRANATIGRDRPLAWQAGKPRGHRPVTNWPPNSLRPPLRIVLPFLRLNNQNADCDGKLVKRHELAAVPGWRNLGDIEGGATNDTMPMQMPIRNRPASNAPTEAAKADTNAPIMKSKARCGRSCQMTP